VIRDTRRGSRRTLAVMIAVLAAALGALQHASAEPYIAVGAGLKCAQCHVNPTGGGKRTAFGTAYAHTALSARIVASGSEAAQWTGEVDPWLAVGGDLRAGLDAVDAPGADTQNDFAVTRGTVYGEFRAIPRLLTLYVDEQFAPGGAINRESYALLTPAQSKYEIKVGQFFLPFGMRLQDDTALVRQVSGVTFDTPDRGVELGLELPKWSTQIALTNGTAGGAEIDAGKQVSMSAAYVRPMWRLGASYNVNNAKLGDRRMESLFAGLRTGPIAWLAEIDSIGDDLPGGGRRRMQASLLEGNWRFAKGHNLKLSYGFLDPDRDTQEDQRERYSLIWEYSPMQLLQLRIGLRDYNDVPGAVQTNRNEAFLELHAYL
jgi:hypothetical protein